MSSQKEKTVLCNKRPNEENESIAEVSSGQKKLCLQKQNDQTVLPPPQFESFIMSKEFSYSNQNNQEMDCVDQCKSVNRGTKPKYFDGDVYMRRNTQYHLGVSVSKDRDVDIDNHQRIFSWKFGNEITDEAWPHIRHFFTHLLEPHGTVKYVALVPFDMEIWEDLTTGTNSVDTISTEKLKIDFDMREFAWVEEFSDLYCSAKTLEWTIGMEDDLILTKECMDSIGEFIGIQGDSFDKFVMTYEHGKYNIDEFAGEIVKMFQDDEDPSTMIKEISLKLFNHTRFAHSNVIQCAKVFPFSSDENEDRFKRVYKNLNSDYTMQTNQSVDGGWRTINFTVIEPTSQ